jgi:hypothetical protein
MNIKLEVTLVGLTLFGLTFGVSLPVALAIFGILVILGSKSWQHAVFGFFLIMLGAVLFVIAVPAMKDDNPTVVQVVTITSNPSPTVIASTLAPTNTPTNISTNTAMPTSTSTLTNTLTPSETPTFTLTSIHQSSIAFPQYIFTECDRQANGRQRPCLGANCEIVALFSNGDVVDVVGRAEGDEVDGTTEWFVVLHDDDIIYVHSSLARNNQLACYSPQSSSEQIVEQPPPAQNTEGQQTSNLPSQSGTGNTPPPSAIPSGDTITNNTSITCNTGNNSAGGDITTGDCDIDVNINPDD